MSDVNVTYNGFSVGDGTDLIITSLEGTGAPELRVGKQDKAGRDGGFFWNSLYSPRVVSLKVAIICATVDEFFSKKRSLVNAWKKSLTALPLTIKSWDGTSRDILAYPQILPEITHKAGEPTSTDTQIEFYCPSPFFTDSSATKVELALAEVTGFDFPFDFPFDISATSTLNSYTFTNDGDVEAQMRIKFENVTNPALTNVTTGEFVQLSKTIAGSNYVEIYYDIGRRVLENGTSSVESSFSGTTEALFLPVGESLLRFSASTYSATAKCTITIQKNYLST